MTGTLYNVTQTVFSSTDGTLVYAEAIGNKHLPALVFVHGLALTALVWAQILRDPRLLQFFYLVAYDMRGHGRSGKPATIDGHSSKLYADDFAAVSNGFGLNSPLFIGWSLGSTIAADITLHLPPDAISGIVWTTPMPYIDPDVIAAVARPEVQGLFPGLMTTDNVTLSVETKHAFVDTLFNDPPSVPWDIKWSWVGSSTLLKPEHLSIVTSRPQDPAGLFKAGARGLPLLLLSGGQDKQLRWEPVWDIARKYFKDSSVVLIPKGSHALFYDFKDEYVNELAKFAKRVFRIRK
ncbi:hypothetical protein EST38_g1459 [Candolleomyces aberdarensis]|uniref:AB hydrolase-1 domain-containing protein n=1 Tax=Candolleomyces aberdarensis TaxID=2316362 RepID=A0A4Q2DXY4_9AGAR|nr:hypothetical protein EST38_g1459 [Candolleomyces aberdarensis]